MKSYIHVTVQKVMSYFHMKIARIILLVLFDYASYYRICQVK